MTNIQKDHLMILLESIDSKMQITLESVTGLNHKIDSFRDELKEDIAVVNCKVMGLSKRVDAFEKNLSDRIDTVYHELVAHRNDTELHPSHSGRSLKSIK